MIIRNIKQDAFTTADRNKSNACTENRNKILEGLN